MNSRIRRWLRNEEGSFTLEASMVFPAIFFALLTLILLSMYMYQKVVLYDAASISAERAAFRWDNSYRDPLSGMGQTGNYDGLYWRISDNGALKSLFGFDGSPASGGYTVQIGDIDESAGETSGGDRIDDSPSSLPALKLSRTAKRIPRPFEGEMSYSYGLLQKGIGVKLRQPLSIRPLELMLGHSEPRAASSAEIVDPVELIRNVDLVRYYTAKFEREPGGESKRKQAAAVLDKRSKQKQ
ncbi:TadE/TadG family type IV pilus assembly protein [Paenibacillus nasutitermitis]|uniref:TadE-like protein n=1 Tax=Paenibacillus nasutitermitis TaxID=1652958 RepID=A0A917DXQ9_9BACL|nr:TadE family protein [Paenibacillus nasutitermitis]GGD76693.1 hypothetical protein GCM10010911_38510 [Paenibacillus nasutitermitis]